MECVTRLCGGLLALFPVYQQLLGVSYLSKILCRRQVLNIGISSDIR